MTNHKYMLFDESRWTQARFPDRQRFRIFCPAKFLHGANATFGLSGKTNKCAEIGECGIVNPGVGFWKKRGCILPKRFSASDRVDGFPKIKKPCQNASSVSFDDWDWLIESEAADGVRGVFPDSWKLLHLLDRSRETSAVSIHDGLCGGVQISRAHVIAEALPCAQHIVFGSASQ